METLFKDYLQIFEIRRNGLDGVQKLVEKNGIPTRQLNKDIKNFQNGISAKLLMK